MTKPMVGLKFDFQCPIEPDHHKKNRFQGREQGLDQANETINNKVFMVREQAMDTTITSRS